MPSISLKLKSMAVAIFPHRERGISSDCVQFEPTILPSTSTSTGSRDDRRYLAGQVQDSDPIRRHSTSSAFASNGNRDSVLSNRLSFSRYECSTPISALSTTPNTPTSSNPLSSPAKRKKRMSFPFVADRGRDRSQSQDQSQWYESSVDGEYTRGGSSTPPTPISSYGIVGYQFGRGSIIAPNRTEIGGLSWVSGSDRSDSSSDHSKQLTTKDSHIGSRHDRNLSGGENKDRQGLPLPSPPPLPSALFSANPPLDKSQFRIRGSTGNLTPTLLIPSPGCSTIFTPDTPSEPGRISHSSTQYDSNSQPLHLSATSAQLSESRSASLPLPSSGSSRSDMEAKTNRRRWGGVDWSPGSNLEDGFQTPPEMVAVALETTPKLASNEKRFFNNESPGQAAGYATMADISPRPDASLDPSFSYATKGSSTPAINSRRASYASLGRPDTGNTLKSFATAQETLLEVEKESKGDKTDWKSFWKGEELSYLDEGRENEEGDTFLSRQVTACLANNLSGLGLSIPQEHRSFSTLGADQPHPFASGTRDAGGGDQETNVRSQDPQRPQIHHSTSLPSIRDSGRLTPRDSSPKAKNFTGSSSFISFSRPSTGSSTTSRENDSRPKIPLSVPPASIHMPTGSPSLKMAQRLSTTCHRDGGESDNKSIMMKSEGSEDDDEAFRRGYEAGIGIGFKMADARRISELESYQNSSVSTSPTRRRRAHRGRTEMFESGKGHAGGSLRSVPSDSTFGNLILAKVKSIRNQESDFPQTSLNQTRPVRSGRFSSIATRKGGISKGHKRSGSDSSALLPTKKRLPKSRQLPARADTPSNLHRNGFNRTTPLVLRSQGSIPRGSQFERSIPVWADHQLQAFSGTKSHIPGRTRSSSIGSSTAGSISTPGAPTPFNTAVGRGYWTTVPGLEDENASFPEGSRTPERLSSDFDEVSTESDQVNGFFGEEGPFPPRKRFMSPKKAVESRDVIGLPNAFFSPSHSTSEIVTPSTSALWSPPPGSLTSINHAALPSPNLTSQSSLVSQLSFPRLVSSSSPTKPSFFTKPNSGLVRFGRGRVGDQNTVHVNTSNPGLSHVTERPLMPTVEASVDFSSHAHTPPQSPREKTSIPDRIDRTEADITRVCQVPQQTNDQDLSEQGREPNYAATDFSRSSGLRRQRSLKDLSKLYKKQSSSNILSSAIGISSDNLERRTDGFQPRIDNDEVQISPEGENTNQQRKVQRASISFALPEAKVTTSRPSPNMTATPETTSLPWFMGGGYRKKRRSRGASTKTTMPTSILKG